MTTSPDLAAQESDDPSEGEETGSGLIQLMEKDILKRAEAYSQKGIEYYKQEKYELALEEFTSAHELIPSITNLYNIARCLDNLGRVKEAAKYYEEYIDKGGSKKWKALEYLTTIKSTPSWVQIESTPAGAEVFIDWDKFRRGKTPLMVKLKPGKHVIGFGLLGYIGVKKEVIVPYADELLVAVYMKKAKSKEDTQPVWEMIPEEETSGGEAEGTGGVVGIPSLEDPDIQIQQKPKHRVSALLLVGGGFSLPIMFEAAGMFYNVGATLGIEVKKGLDIGIGVDGFIGGNANLVGIHAHAGFFARIKRTFHLFGRLGIGALLLSIRSEGLAIPKGIHKDLYIRPSLGLGWDIKGLTIRLALLSFSLNLGLDDVYDGPTGFYFPHIWLGYRF